MPLTPHQVPPVQMGTLHGCAYVIATKPYRTGLLPPPLHRGANRNSEDSMQEAETGLEARALSRVMALGSLVWLWARTQPLPGDLGSHGQAGQNRGCPWRPKVPIKCSRPSGDIAVDYGMAEQGPEPGRAWRVLALCGAAVFLAAAAAGGALLAWNLAAAASRRSRCPEPEAGINATAPPGDLVPEVDDLLRRLSEATHREEALARQLSQAEGVRRELEKALRACEGHQVGGQGWVVGHPECRGRGPAQTAPGIIPPMYALVSPIFQCE